MVRTINNGRPIPPRYQPSHTVVPQPQTVIIVYEQPKVNIVRRYTKTIVPHVNPEEYIKRYDHVLLDTSTLLALTRRLNIQEYLITPPNPR